MDNVYEQFHQEGSDYEYNKKKAREFFAVMQKIKDVPKTERAEFVKNTWGEINEYPKQIHYGKFCRVQIDKKGADISFQFACINCDFEDLQKEFPGLAEEIKKMAEAEFERKKQQAEEEKEFIANADEKQTAETDYLNMYRNLNINKLKNPKNNETKQKENKEEKQEDKKDNNESQDE